MPTICYARWKPRKVIFETGVLAGWDSGLLTFLLWVLSRCRQLGIEVERDGNRTEQDLEDAR